MAKAQEAYKMPTKRGKYSKNWSKLIKPLGKIRSAVMLKKKCFLLKVKILNKAPTNTTETISLQVGELLTPGFTLFNG
jgi:hypothetical protein